MNIIKVFLGVCICVIIFNFNESRGQGISCFSEEKVVPNLIQSINEAIDLYPRNEAISVQNFNLIIKSFDTAFFLKALDKLFKMNDVLTDYYICILYIHGDAKLIIRGYSGTYGKELGYYLYPSEFKTDFFISDYFHNERLFAETYHMKMYDFFPESADLLSISICQNGVFKSHVFQANNLIPEYNEKIRRLLENKW